jgi:hypothetical protein
MMYCFAHATVKRFVASLLLAATLPVPAFVASGRLSLEARTEYQSLLDTSMWGIYELNELDIFSRFGSMPE